MNIIPDDFSPIYQGDTLTPFAPQFVESVNGIIQPYNLSGLTITMKMVNEAGTVINCAGPWFIDNATTGNAHYPWQSADVSTPGTWTLYVKLTNGTGSFAHVLTKTLEIISAP